MPTGAFRPKASRATAWWNLTPNQKRDLQSARLGGEFGGESGAGVGRAPYFWGQEYGNPAANIKAQHFAKKAWETFKARGLSVLRDAARTV